MRIPLAKAGSPECSQSLRNIYGYGISPGLEFFITHRSHDEMFASCELRAEYNDVDMGHLVD